MAGYAKPGYDGFYEVDAEIRFERLVDRSGDCHIFMGGKQRGGYGVFWCGKLMRAHRASWLLRFGDIPIDKLVLHKCRNRACVKIEHLYIGTHKDNVQDAIREGTFRCFAKKLAKEKAAAK